MTVKTDNIQIGNNPTTSQNFILSQNADGTGKLSRQSGGDIITWDGTGKVATPNNIVPAFRAYQNVVSAAFTTDLLMPFQVKDFDTASAFNNTASTVGNTLAYSFNPLVAGYYLITASVQTAATTTSFSSIIFKNGLNIKYGTFTASSLNSLVSIVSDLVYLDGTGVGANSNIQIYAAQTTSGTSQAGTRVTSFSGVLVRAA